MKHSNLIFLILALIFCNLKCKAEIVFKVGERADIERISEFSIITLAPDLDGEISLGDSLVYRSFIISFPNNNIRHKVSLTMTKDFTVKWIEYTPYVANNFLDKQSRIILTLKNIKIDENSIEISIFNPPILSKEEKFKDVFDRIEERKNHRKIPGED